MAKDLIQLTGWKTARRVIFAPKLLGVIRGAVNAEFWDHHKHEFAVYVTNLPTTLMLGRSRSCTASGRTPRMCSMS